MDSFTNGQNNGQPVSTTVDVAPNLETPSIASEDIARELAIRPYKVFFGGDVPTDDQPKLDYLIRQLNPNSKLHPDEVIAKMRKIESRLGASHENRLERVYRWVKLVNSSREMLLEAL